MKILEQWDDGDDGQEGMPSARRTRGDGPDASHMEQLAALQVVAQMLAEHGIDTECFGKNEAKTLEEFAAEASSGERCVLSGAVA